MWCWSFGNNSFRIDIKKKKNHVNAKDDSSIFIIIIKFRNNLTSKLAITGLGRMVLFIYLLLPGSAKTCVAWSLRSLRVPAVIYKQQIFE